MSLGFVFPGNTRVQQTLQVTQKAFPSIKRCCGRRATRVYSHRINTDLLKERDKGTTKTIGNDAGQLSLGTIDALRWPREADRAAWPEGRRGGRVDVELGEVGGDCCS